MSQNQVQGASSAWSIASIVIGVVSIFMNWTFLAPIAGIIVGVMAKGREPHARTMANWGIGISVVMLIGGILLWVLAGGLILGLLGIGVAASAG